MEIHADHFPERIHSLPKFAGPFDAFQIKNPNVDVLLASYPAGTEIKPHTHETENCGVITQGELILILDGQEQSFKTGEWYHLPPQTVHAARFEVDTSEIEFWFKPAIAE